MNQSNANTGDGYDPVAAFEHRRRIFNTVQEIQRREHEAMASIARSIESRKRELLVQLSQWLLKQESSSPSHLEVKRLCGCDIGEWLELQSAAKPLETEVRRLEQAVTAAHAAYRAEEPWGHLGLGGVAELFASEERRLKLQALNADTVSKKGQLQGTNARLQENIQRRRQFGKRFLRSCLQNIRELENSTVFGNSVQRIVREMNSSIENEWNRFQSYNRGAMKSAVADLDRLWAGYFGGGNNA